jgi:predicted nucleotidyltransferase
MDKEKIIARLREHQSDLKSGGIERLFLFGSHARGTAVRIHPMWI